MEQELLLARNIQASALPTNFDFKHDGFEIYAGMKPARHVGGDFYDFFFVESDKLALVIADVAGKGIPAAMFMMRSKTAIRSLAETGNMPAEIFEKANETGYKTQVTEIESPGIIYQDDRVTVEAFPVSHGTLTCYGYKFVTDDRTIVISGDTCPLDIVAEKAKGADILLHEVEYAGGLSSRSPKWQKYHREVHTLSTDLAKIAAKARPKLLVTYHRIYHMNILDNSQNLVCEMNRRCDTILQEIRDAGYDGPVVNGNDLDCF